MPIKNKSYGSTLGNDEPPMARITRMKKEMIHEELSGDIIGAAMESRKGALQIAPAVWKPPLLEMQYSYPRHPRNPRF